MVDRLAILQLTHHFRLVGCYINAKVSESSLSCICCGERRGFLFVTKQNSNVHKKNPTINSDKALKIRLKYIIQEAARKSVEKYWQNCTNHRWHSKLSWGLQKKEAFYKATVSWSHQPVVEALYLVKFVRSIILAGDIFVIVLRFRNQT